MKMKSISGLGLGLSLVFGCLLLALVAELYYLLWWKKKIITNIDGQFSHIFCCWKNPISSSSQQLCDSSPTLVHEPQSSSNSNKDLWLKQENINSLEYFPRFLFTITEETREDLESEDGGVFKNRKQCSAGFLESPFLTPPASPPYYTPPLTPSFSDRQPDYGPFFDLERDAEFNRLRCSPPPVFKFLRDAEDKLIVQRRKMMENKDEENGQFITLNINEEGICQNDYRNNFSSTSSQVFNLVSSKEGTLLHM